MLKDIFKKRVFISHSHDEKELADYLANWLQSRFEKVKCFSSSRPGDLSPGSEWFKEIVSEAKSSKYCFNLLSPENCRNNWLHFEAGLVEGNKKKTFIVPVIYGGLIPSHLPAALPHYQVLSLNDQATFNEFILKHFGGNDLSNNQQHNNFINEMPEMAQRLLSYGSCSRLIPNGIHAEPLVLINRFPTNGVSFHMIDRVANGNQISSIRVTFAPMRAGPVHWKFGLSVLRGDQEVFTFHSGCHNGHTSWTIYYDKCTHDHYFNYFGQLDIEQMSGIQFWFNEPRSATKCVGIESNGNKIIFKTESRDGTWPLTLLDWDRVRVSGWADGLPFRIDNINIAVERS